MKNKDYQALTVTEDALKIIKKCFHDEKKGDKGARKVAKKYLKEYFVKTNDDSYTFNSNIINGKSETMHTHHGAITESLEKFVKPAKLEGKKEIKILDICSGLGYNAAACIEYLEDSVKIEIDMVEISKETLAAALFIDSPISSYNIIKKAVEDRLYEKGILGFKFHDKKISERININIYIDDARKVVKHIEGHKKYDAIFLDPFSPLKSPELYSIEFFDSLKNLLNESGVILTYTSAAPVRSAMVQTGLHVGEGPQFGRKSGGTIASNDPELIERQLRENDERMVALSDAGIPFRDPNLNGSSDKIIERRENERKCVRGTRKFASTVKTPIYLFKDIEEERLKKRVLKNINALGIDNLKSKKARFIICPQYEECICECGSLKLDNSRDRINEMMKRLSKITE
ncbi:tRNA (5-methylaminomethyl-2-thiouridine)(34)-methyltransferase MnmD [Methanobacterium oryzae]|uniref:tRNA (5-methylaminomethyl-2-thiouridine)(34)-methyltransferase MnmD n=1 Tax=Methanobacterium oryzae TaxID=69540 RepID=UPI003D19B7B0